MPADLNNLLKWKILWQHKICINKYYFYYKTMFFLSPATTLSFKAPIFCPKHFKVNKVKVKIKYVICLKDRTPFISLPREEITKG